MNRVLLPLRILSKILSKIITTIVLTLLYFFVIGPISIIGKMFGKDFISEKKLQTESYWQNAEQKEPTLENFSKPY